MNNSQNAGLDEPENLEYLETNQDNPDSENSETDYMEYTVELESSGMANEDAGMNITSD